MAERGPASEPESQKAMNKTLERYAVHICENQGSFQQRLMVDVEQGLTGTPKRLPPKYFYDARGSALFEQITKLP